MAFSHRSMRPTKPARAARPAAAGGAPTLLNERHLVDFAQRRDPRAYLPQAGIAQEGHAALPGRALDFRSRPPIDDHFPDAIGKIEKLSHSRAPAVAAAGALQAARAFGELERAPLGRVETGFFQDAR